MQTVPYTHALIGGVSIRLDAIYLPAKALRVLFYSAIYDLTEIF